METMKKSSRSYNPGWKQIRGAVVLVAGAGIGAMLSGCGLGPVATATATSTPVSTAALVQGKVMGGQQPVAGVTLQLYAVGTGYGSAATGVGPSFTTTALGNFTFPAYTCPSPSALMVLVGTGGTPIGGSPNANLALSAGLGRCDSIPAFIDMNELTTVATVYALNGFMTGPTNIGAPASNASGIINAFAAINKVVNIATGVASGPGLPAGATLPVSEINALGNILQNCVNSAGGTASDTSTPCGKLFSYTTVNAVAPTDTITATLNIAKHPSVNVGSLNNLQASSPAFVPALSVNSPPTDWTISINYTGGGLNTPQTIINDAAGNVYTTNPGNNTLTKLLNTGAVDPASQSGVNSGSTFNSPYGIAMDTQGNLWVTNFAGGGALVRTDSNLNPVVSYSGMGINAPKGLAIDGSNAIWIANSGANTVTKYSPGIGGGTYSTGGINAPTSIAISPK